MKLWRMIFLLIGGVLSVVYNHVTTSKNDYKEIGFYNIVMLYILLFSLNWVGLVISIGLDINAIKKQ